MAVQRDLRIAEVPVRWPRCQKPAPTACANRILTTLGLLYGIPLAQVATKLGSESPTTTLQSYTAPGTVETFAMPQVIALPGPLPARDKAS